MNIVEKRIDEIRPYENNPRFNDEAVEYVAESIKQYGWKQPIVVDAGGVIIAGHTRYKAAKLLGMDTVPVLVASDLTAEQVKAYRLADNKVSDFSQWDNKLLLQELDEIPDDMFTGFDLSETYDNLLDETDNDAVEMNEAGTTYEVTFRSEDMRKIELIKQAWENMNDE
jgi:site-specific DNA-methyltransferase (adenine-specific)